MIVILDLTQPVFYKTFQENLDIVFDRLKHKKDFSIYSVDQFIIFNTLLQLSTITDWSKLHGEILNYQNYVITELGNIRLFYNDVEIFKNSYGMFEILDLVIDINNYSNFQISTNSTYTSLYEECIIDLNEININLDNING